MTPDWIYKEIYPLIKNCAIPEEARNAVIEWSKSQPESVAAMAIFAVDFMNAHYDPDQQTYNVTSPSQPE